MKKFSYHMPTKIAFGDDSLDSVDDYIAGRTVLLLTTKGFESRGMINRVKDLTKSVVHTVTDIKSHPDIRELEMIYNETRDFQYQVILAIGGGSVLDAAKVISIRGEDRKFSFIERLVEGNLVSNQYRKTPIIAVPTTAGTGSEITPWATIWDRESKRKISLHLPDLFSEIAIYDPKLTLSVPEKTTISTGLDSLSHALESIWNKNASPITIRYAVDSAKLMLKYLPLLVNDLDNVLYRKKMMLSCMYAGMAFSNTQTAIAHAISYYVTVNKGVEHGIACSFTLPMLIDRVIGRYEEVDSALLEIFGELNSMKIREVYLELGVSTDFSHYGIKAEEIDTIKNFIRNNQRTKNSLVSM